MVFQHRPYPFDGVILAVIRRIISQIDTDSIFKDKFYQALHKLTSMTVIFGSIIRIDNDGMGIKLDFNGWPKVL